MKKPIFSETKRKEWLYPEIEISKLKIKRELEKTKFFKCCEFIIIKINKKLC